MNKRHYLNCLSKEKRTYESNIKKYKRQLEENNEWENSGAKQCSEKNDESVESIANSNLNGLQFSDSKDIISDKELSASDLTGARCEEDIMQRLQRLEENQKILSNDQAAIIENQQQIANKLERIEASIVSKPEMMAQSKLLMEFKVAIKKIEKLICRMTCENATHLEEPASILPLKTEVEVLPVEQKLESPEFSQAMTTYLHKI